jgi:hypothetical protein
VLDLVARQHWSGIASTRGIPDESREVTDHEDDPVAKILEGAQLLDRDRMPDVQIGSGRIEPLLHDQGNVGRDRALELLEQFVLGDDFRHSVPDSIELFARRRKHSGWTTCK